jgi:hypothetical protein
MRTHESRPEAEMASVTDRQNMPEKDPIYALLRARWNAARVCEPFDGSRDGVWRLLHLSSFAFAVYVRLQPPTVIRVDSEGEATVVGGTPFPATLAD